MRHLVFRFVSILILALSLAPAASAEVWTFAHFVETGAARFSVKSFDSDLFLVNQGVHNCKVVLLNESSPPGPLTVNGKQVCPPAAPCPVTVNGFAKLSIHDKITQAVGGTGWGNVRGEIRLTCTEPLARLNATLYITNYHTDGFDASFAADSGKILP